MNPEKQRINIAEACGLSHVTRGGVTYTDDGCSIYQCLECKAQWESRGNPESGHWRFCPVCGTSWRGRMPNDDEASERRWERHSRWPTDKQKKLASLCDPLWQVYFKNRFSDGWEPDGSPFLGPAHLALSFVNKHKRHSQPKQEYYADLYRIELVAATETFHLP
jgi:hypothetical protein